MKNLMNMSEITHYIKSFVPIKMNFKVCQFNIMKNMSK